MHAAGINIFNNENMADSDSTISSGLKNKTKQKTKKKQQKNNNNNKINKIKKEHKDIPGSDRSLTCRLHRLKFK